MIYSNIENSEQTIHYLKKILTEKRNIRLNNNKIRTYIENVPGALEFLKLNGYKREYYPSKKGGLESYFSLTDNTTCMNDALLLLNKHCGNVIIKVKLPDGKHIYGAFEHTEKIIDVIHFIESITLYTSV